VLSYQAWYRALSLVNSIKKALIFRAF